MKLSCYAYELPFSKPLVTSSRVYQNREGWILSWKEEGNYFWGEAAPLPGFSQESMSDINHKLTQYNLKWEKILQSEQPIEQFQIHYKTQGIPPSLQFALDSLAYQVEAYRNRQPVKKFLFDNFSSSSIPVNAVLSLADNDNILSNIQYLIDTGFNTLKCKIGQDFSREARMLKQIRKRYPTLNIRLDANQAWSLPDAIKHLSKLEALQIQYCEEPLEVPLADNFRELNEHINIPLALDESLAQKNDWQALLPYCSVLVIKPMVVGRFAALRDIRERAREYQCKRILTSSLESSIGRYMTALLATGLGSAGYAHGLNTGSLLLEDTIPGFPRVKHGKIQFDTDTLLPQTYLQRLEELSTTIITTS